MQIESVIPCPACKKGELRINLLVLAGKGTIPCSACGAIPGFPDGVREQIGQAFEELQRLKKQP